MPKYPFLFTAALLVLLLTSCAKPNPETQKEEIKALLTEFLDNVDSKDMHDRFWDETLIYTSSSGSRFGKAQIMSGFDSNPDSESSDQPSSTYSAEDIQIQIHGNIAVLTFQLVGKTGDSISNYLNSGTLVNTKGQWKVVNWQATKMAEK